MPINIPNNLPAHEALAKENIFIMTDAKASSQDIRPLEIAIVNLMPKKIETETQLLRLLSNTPLQVNIELVQTVTHVAKNTSADHLMKFYDSFADISDRKFDGLIITGAPVEQIPFEDVDYWDELCRIMEWSKSNVFSTFHICWGAQAGLYYHHGIKKYPLKEKLSGIYEHCCEAQNHPLLKGFDETFYVPHSRYTGVRREDIEKCPDLKILTSSFEAGVHIVADKTNRQFFATGHSEYDLMTLADEYKRDIGKGLDIKMPANYFPDNDPTRRPKFTWRCHANLMFANWLNYCVYQETPYDLNDLETIK